MDENFCFKEGVLFCEDVEMSRLEDVLAVENMTPCYVYSRYVIMAHMIIHNDAHSCT